MNQPSEQAQELRRTPLIEEHRNLDAKLVPFAGWEMPVWYDSIVDEHLAVRESAGLFDVSHMGEFFVSGPDALDFLDYMVTNDLKSISDGRAQYNVMHTDDGGIIDDLIVYRRAEDDFFCVVNASRREADFDWLSEHLPDSGVELEDRSDDFCLLALQGPEAPAIFAELGDGLDEVAELGMFRHREVEIMNNPVTVATTGYTGEPGFEIMVPNETAPWLWNHILETGEDFGIEPVGLGARDTLRLEKAYSLYGHELTEETSAWEANLGWVVDLDKGDFLGRDFLKQQKEAGLERKVTGIAAGKNNPSPRQGTPVEDGDGEQIGEVTSGSYSPSTDQNIALAYLDIDRREPGSKVYMKIRNRSVQGEIVETPFC